MGNLFLSFEVEHMWTEESDHNLILIWIESEKKMEKRPFKFLEAWMTNESSYPIIMK